MLVCSSASAQERPTRTVLVIQSGAENEPGNVVRKDAIRRTVRSHSAFPVEVFSEHLRSDRLPEREATASLAEHVRGAFTKRPIDVVVADSQLTFDFAVQHRETFFANTPLVFLAVQPPPASVIEQSGGVTGLIVDPFQMAGDLIRTVHPSVKRIAIVAEGPDREMTQRIHRQLRGSVRDMEPRVDIAFIRARTVQQLTAAVKAVPSDGVILFAEFAGSDISGTPATPRAEELVAREAPVPVYGVEPRHFGSGIVGGAIHDPDVAGRRLGEMTAQILAGTSARGVPIERGPIVPTFDWRAMQRWRIDASRLPVGARIEFQPPTAWTQDRSNSAIALLLTLESLLIFALLVQRRGRRRAEEASRAHQFALEESYENVRRLAAKLLAAKEENRARTP
jgi:hypothetical protein